MQHCSLGLDERHVWIFFAVADLESVVDKADVIAVDLGAVFRRMKHGSLERIAANFEKNFS